MQNPDFYNTKFYLFFFDLILSSTITSGVFFLQQQILHSQKNRKIGKSRAAYTSSKFNWNHLRSDPADFKCFAPL